MYLSSLIEFIASCLFIFQERRWLRYFRLHRSCMMCWRQWCLLGKLIRRFDFFCFAVLEYLGQNFQLASFFFFLNLIDINVLQARQYAEDVEERREQYEHYNILPLYAVGVKPGIMELSEVVFGVTLWS